MGDPILRLAVERIALPFAETYTSASGSIAEREIVLVRLETGSGRVGWGESAVLSLRGGSGAAQIAGELEQICAACVAGVDAEALARADEVDPGAFSLAGIRSLLAACELAGAGRQALCALDLALHDLAGRIAGEPVCRLLGVEPGPIETNATLVASTPEVAARSAAEWHADGFRAFKLKVGGAEDVDAVAAVRSAIGPECVLAVDANAAWDPPTATRRLIAMAAYDVAVAEQPAASLDELSLLAADERVEAAVAADESVVAVVDAERAARLGIDAVTAKLAKCGGIQAALAVAERAPCWISSALDGPLGIAAAAHAALAATRLEGSPELQGLATQRLFEAWPALDGPALDGPRLGVGARPGLGVELDRDALDRLRLDRPAR